MKVKDFIEAAKSNFAYYDFSNTDFGSIWRVSREDALAHFGEQEIKEINFEFKMQTEKLTDSDKLFKTTLDAVPRIWLKEK